MDRLVVPPAFAGLDLEGDETLVEERVARPVAAVVIAGRHFDADVDETELQVGAELRPGAGVAVSRRGILEPRVVAVLTGRGNRVEDPQPPAGFHVVAPDVPPRVL